MFWHFFVHMVVGGNKNDFILEITKCLIIQIRSPYFLIMGKFLVLSMAILVPVV